MTSPDVKRSCSGIPPEMRDTVTVIVRTDLEGVVARGRCSLSPVDLGLASSPQTVEFHHPGPASTD